MHVFNPVQPRPHSGLVGSHTWRTKILPSRSKNQFKVLGSSSPDVGLQWFNFIKKTSTWKKNWLTKKLVVTETTNTLGQGVLNVIFCLGGNLGELIPLKISRGWFVFLKFREGPDVMLLFQKGDENLPTK